MGNKYIFSPFFKINNQQELIYLDKKKICKVADNDCINNYILKNEGVVFDKILWRTFDSTVLIIEPHADDFALSVLGGTLNLYNVIVMNIFSKTSLNYFAWKDEFSVSSSEYEKLRLDESKFVIEKLLGQKFVSIKETSTRISSKKTLQIKKKIKTEVEKVLSENKSINRIFVPMGVGNHPDHMIVFDSIMEILPSLDKIKVILYPEYPYARCRKSYNERLAYINRKFSINPIIVPVNDKIETIADCVTAYKSQFDDVNRNQMLAIIREDCRALATEYNSDDLIMVYFEIGGIK